MDPTNKPKGPSPHYSLYQREVFKRGGEGGESTIFGHRIPAPICFAPIGINKLYSARGELIPARIAGELGLPYCLSTAASQPIEDVAAVNDEAASVRNESNSVHHYDGMRLNVKALLYIFNHILGLNGGNAKSPRFYQLYMGHDDDITISLLERAWKSGFDVLMLTTDTWQLGWRPTDINIANYVFYYGGTVGNELGASDPVFMRKYGKELDKDSGKWIDSSVWHGKAHTWDKIKWLIGEWNRISGGRPFVIKGIQNVADALKAYEVGCAGIVVTNHAGRQVDGAVGSLEVLPEISQAVGDKMTILFDSGIRTGADVFKAIALGAHAVMVGRLYVWGMSHEGDSGCRHVIKSLLAM
ncbi:hypothetical protein PHLCEN_2v8968 [Hermanssonia centrifuga]|uniref:FMN hydroxy acid dehydrogenase domain-containing protein n=1 Tax=Hermanssonia centrifuga TaxID=98765 RepID=A0A2R6NS33_9APHY|nr:hypothetical protein PHLCEN_2v8968 [Hermanssonia centrifuga]